MKILTVFIKLIFIISILTITIFSQNSSKGKSLPENASLEETQNWLKKQLEKNSKYTITDTFRTETTKISNVQFQKCEFSHQFVKTVFSESRKPKDSDEGAASNISASESFIKTITLNLGNMDLKTVSVADSAKKGYKIFKVYSIGKENTVGFRNDPLNSRFGEGEGSVVYKTYTKTGNQSFVTLTVKADAVEQIKNGFIRAVKLCQKEN